MVASDFIVEISDDFACVYPILSVILLITVRYILHLCVVCIILKIPEKRLDAQDHKTAS